MKGPLTLETPDTDGYVPDKKLVGTRMHHTGNGKTYVITGFAWMGATDQWGYLHLAEGEFGVQLCRPMPALYGDRSNGVPRYTRP